MGDTFADSGPKTTMCSKYTPKLQSSFYPININTQLSTATKPCTYMYWLQNIPKQWRNSWGMSGHLSTIINSGATAMVACADVECATVIIVDHVTMMDEVRAWSGCCRLLSLLFAFGEHFGAASSQGVCASERAAVVDDGRTCS